VESPGLAVVTEIRLSMLNAIADAMPEQASRSFDD
jgi:hypothetical protein